MRLNMRFTVLIPIVFMMTGFAPAQEMISAKAGAISFLEGEVFLGGSRLQFPEYEYIHIENGRSLKTERGRAVMLINPDVYLRLNENSTLRMKSNSLKDTQVVLEQGSAWISVRRIKEGNRIRAQVSGSVIEVKKAGQYRLDADARELRVFSSGAAASVSFENRKANIKKGKMVRLDSNLKPVKFDASKNDYNHEWLAGVIECVLGAVLLDDKPVKVAKGRYNQMEAGQSLSTGLGYAELQLAPYVYLRLGINASLHMEKIKSRDTELVLNRGAALIEVLQKDHIRVRISKSVIEMEKPGLYRLNADTQELHTYGGEAVASAGNKKVKVKNSKMLRLGTDLTPVKFDPSVADILHKWAARRSMNHFVATAAPIPWFTPLRNWKHHGKGWLSNSNYRISLYSEEYYAEWLGNGIANNTILGPSYQTIEDIEFLRRVDPPAGLQPTSTPQSETNP